MPVPILPKISNGLEIKKISRFLKGEFSERNKNLAVIGVSGGIDSALAAKLCELAGLEVKKVSLPYGAISRGAEDYSLKIDITSMADKTAEEISRCVLLDKVDRGNIMARIRMMVQYALARKFKGLVVGTENLSEYYLGYFTLHGDQASDINPVAHLWKTQVIGLAEYLGLPLKKPSADLWEGQTDEKELGFSYEEADPILYLYRLKKMTPQKIIKDFDLNADLVYRVVKRVNDTEYKRQKAPFCGQK